MICDTNNAGALPGGPNARTVPLRGLRATTKGIESAHD